ncbi:MAG: homoserine dehydrogenase [Roseiflexaceae bacterium]|nr:homoserine dehydrogenase [Roseiflexaceae bacterium]
MPRTVRLLLSGMGNVNRSLIEVLQKQELLLAERHGLQFRIVGAADSGGASIDPSGLDLAALLARKRAGKSVASLPGAGQAGMSAPALVAQTEADVLLEATPVDMRTGQPGLDATRAALQKGVHVVIANKGPLALAFQELAALSFAGDQVPRPPTPNPQPPAPRRLPMLRFSACVGGFMPTINVGWRDMRGARIELLEAVLNGTTQIILRAIEQGGSFADALRDAQVRGLAETDPTLDVEGWDAANKLIIFANAVLGQPTTLDDIDVTGITRLTYADLHAAAERGHRVVLLCRAALHEGRYQLSVRPTALPLSHPLARMSGDEMGAVFHTDIAGRLSLQTLERGPEPTAAAMLRDLLEIADGTA